MTPSAPSSSILLLSGASDAAKAPVNSTGNASPGAAPSGFQLLLNEVAQTQQSAEQTLAALLKTTSTSVNNPLVAATDTGNVLPVSGEILPAVTGLSKEVAKDNPKASDDNKKDDQHSDDLAGLQLLWGPLVDTQKPVQSVAATASNNDASKSGGDGLTPPLPTPGDIASLAANAKSASDDNAAKTQDQILLDKNAVASASASASVARDAQSVASLTATSKDSAANLTGVLDATGTAQKSDVGSDFSALLKQLDVTQQTNATQQNVSQPNGGNTSNVVMTDGGRMQSARSYLEATGSTATVSVPVGTNGWTDAIVDKVMWFSAHQINSAEIQLNPPDLGPLQVRISMQHDQTSVVFSSQHAAVRDALDQTLPRLRDMMGSQGVQLLDVSVGGQGAQRQNHRGEGQGQHNGKIAGLFGVEDDTALVAVSRVVGPRLSTSTVDAYV